MNTSLDTQTTEYGAMLARMINLTDKVSTAAINMDTDEMHRLLAEREVLCDNLIAHRHALTALDEDSARMEAVLMARQANCESIVAANLAETRKNLGQLHRKKDLGSAYTSKSTTNQAVYLDNRT